MGSLAASQLQGLRFDPELGLLYVPPHVCMGFLQLPKNLQEHRLSCKFLQLPSHNRSGDYCLDTADFIESLKEIL